MMTPSHDHSKDFASQIDVDERARPLAARAMVGDQVALGELITLYRTRLKHLIDIRLDMRLRQRLDASDILQEVFVRGVRGSDGSVLSDDMSPYVWLRQITIWRLLDIQRKHFGSKRRDPRVEHRSQSRDGTSNQIVDMLADSLSSPSNIVVREEKLRELREALDSLDPIDREILILRHCEQMSRSEAAETLGITVSASAKRYYRAIKRIRTAMGAGTSSVELC
jgi:RNA polymerase sigma-70 factor (ECF subfamily)